MAREKNIVKYKRPINFNVGIVVFCIIIIYILFSVFQYLTSESIAAYQVSQGQIASKNRYRGLILREESLGYAEHSGYLNYYMKNASRVSVNDTIYSVDTSGRISDKINASTTRKAALDNELFREVVSSLNDFEKNYSLIDYADAGSYKAELASQLNQTINANALESLNSEVMTAEANNTFFRCTSPQTGVVAYYTDGYEDIRADSFTAEHLDSSEYSKNILNTRGEIKSGEAAYKIVTSENWNVMIGISDALAEELAEGSSVKVRFCKDDYTISSRYTLIKDAGRFFLNLQFSTAMIRYINDRFTDIELLTNEKSGLKIPVSAITTKDFYAIPKENFIKGGDSNHYGLLIVHMTEEGKRTEFVAPTIYYETETAFYIDDEDVSTGDIVQISDSSKTYVIGTDIESLIGVYNINKGYAVFKQINIIYQNSDYAIVEPKTAYGIALYDHIALDGSKLTENQLVAR